MSYNTRRLHSNPAGVERFAWQEPPHESPGEGYAERFQARNQRVLEQTAPATEFYTGVMREIARGMAQRFYTARQAGAFDPPRTPAEAEALPRFVAATQRDTLAFLFAELVARGQIYRPGVRGRPGKGRPGLEFAELQAFDERVAQLYERYFAALGRFAARPEVFGERLRTLRAYPPAFAAAIHAAGLHVAAMQSQLSQDQPHRAGKEAIRVRTALKQALQAIGWTEAGALLETINLTALRSAAARAEKLAAHGVPALRPALEALEEAAREGDLSPEGARELRRQQRAVATRVARAQREAHAREAAAHAAYAGTDEEYEVTGRDGIVLRWSHRDPASPGMSQHERLVLSPGYYAGVRSIADYHVATHAPAPRSRTGYRSLREASMTARYDVGDPTGSLGEFYGRGWDHEQARARLAVMFRRALAILASASRGERPPPAAFENPRRPQRTPEGRGGVARLRQYGPRYGVPLFDVMTLEALAAERVRPMVYASEGMLTVDFSLPSRPSARALELVRTLETRGYERSQPYDAPHGLGAIWLRAYYRPR